MFILTVPWDLRSLWVVLTITAKVYLLLLTTATGYSTYCLARATCRLRELLKRMAAADAGDMGRRLAAMNRGIATLRQFHALLLLLFGVCCTNEVFATLRMIQNSSMSLSAAQINAFEPVAAFAFVVFVVFIFLHVFQWSLEASLQSAIAANSKTCRKTSENPPRT